MTTMLVNDCVYYATTCMQCGADVTAKKPDGVLCADCRRENKRMYNYEQYLRRKARGYSDKTPQPASAQPMGYAPMVPGRGWRNYA